MEVRLRLEAKPLTGVKRPTEVVALQVPSMMDPEPSMAVLGTMGQGLPMVLQVLALLDGRWMAEKHPLHHIRSTLLHPQLTGLRLNIHHLTVRRRTIQDTSEWGAVFSDWE